MFSLASFVVSNLDGTSPTTCTIVGDAVDLQGPDVPIAVLGHLRDGVRNLLDQPRDDGEYSASEQVVGGPLLTLARPDAADPSLDTIQIGSLPPWSRSKIDGGFIGALLAFGLITP